MRGLSDPDETGRICRSDTVSATFKVVPANVGTPYSLSQPYVEPDVDINYLEVMAYASPHVFYGPGNGPSGTDDWSSLDITGLSKTISVAFGLDEDILPGKGMCIKCMRIVSAAHFPWRRVLFATDKDGIDKGGRLSSDGSVQFRVTFCATCKCGIFPTLEVKHWSRTLTTSLNC